jgi:hypothetical protein
MRAHCVHYCKLSQEQPDDEENEHDRVRCFAVFLRSSAGKERKSLRLGLRRSFERLVPPPG